MIHAFRRIAVIVLSALALAHCAQYPNSGDKRPVSQSEQNEVQTGAQAHQAVLRVYSALDNPALQAYVNEIGQQLARQSPRPSLPWHFTVLDSRGVNAFSLPGGYVYITRGLLAYLNSEAELAGVLGHEIGHVIARHGVRQQSVPATAAVGSGRVLDMNPQVGPTLSRSEMQPWTAGYGRDDELEADRLGAMYLAKAGYNPQAMIEVNGELNNQAAFAAKRAKHDGRPLPVYHGIIVTAPSNDARLKQGVDEANPYLVANPREGRNEFLQKMVGVVFGDSADQGQIRNNLLLNPKRGLAIQFPPGWHVLNQTGRVMATHPEGDAVIEFQAGSKDDQPLEALQNGLKLDAGARYESGSLSGFPAAFAAGAQQGKPVVAAAVDFNGVLYLIAGMTQDKQAYGRERDTLRSVINSFRAITPIEVSGARPYVLKVILARPGMTMAALARLSPLGADAESQLRLINNLYPIGEPKPGQLLKIVH